MISEAARKRRITAYHEAGHAALHLALGVQFTKVTIIPNEDYLGAVHGCSLLLPSPDDNPERFCVLTPEMKSNIDREILIFLGGPLAEHRFLGKEWLRLNFYDLEGYSPPDLAEVSRLGEYLLEPEDEALNEIKRYEEAFHDGEPLDRLYYNEGTTPSLENQIDDQLKGHLQIAQNLVEINWPRIERLAQALLKRRELTQDEAASL